MTDIEPASTEEEPITREEMQRRGMDEHLSEIVCRLVSAATRLHLDQRFNHRQPITRAELAIFGLGPECACGERGLELGEEVCKYCPSEDDDDESTEAARDIAQGAKANPVDG